MDRALQGQLIDFQNQTIFQPYLDIKQPIKGTILPTSVVKRCQSR